MRGNHAGFLGTVDRVRHSGRRGRGISLRPIFAIVARRGRRITAIDAATVAFAFVVVAFLVLR